MAISLSSGVRQALSALSTTTANAQSAQLRLATGKRVNGAIDNPVNFFTAQKLNNRAEDLTGLLDGISNSIQTIKAASSGVEGITKLVKSAQSIVKQARASNDADTRTSLQAQYKEVLTQIDTLARDSGFNGVNLLGTDELKTVFNEKTGTDNTGTTGKNSLTIKGGIDDDADPDTANVAVSATSLEIDADTTAFSSTYDPDDADEVETANTALDTASDNLTKALSSLSTVSSTLGSNLAVVQARQEFSKSLIETLKTGADNLVVADTNEEAANLLALQTRQQLSSTALSLSNQADQGVLRLF